MGSEVSIHRGSGTSAGALSIKEGCASAFVALILPALMYAAHLGAVAKFVYPASAFLAAGSLYYRRSPWYAGLTIWLFCATPLVRRLVDEQAGWDASNPVLLAPYLACSFATLSLGGFLFRRRTTTLGPFLLVIGCIAYGLLMAMADGRVLSGIVDAMKWSAGPLVAVYMLASVDRTDTLHRAATLALTIAAPLMAVYGIAQYLSPAKWDADWMVNVQSLGFDSIGTPEPFSLRVFGTMNSPGSLATILMAGILVTLQRRFVYALPALAVMVLGILLTQYRSVWAGALIGVAYMAYAGSARLRFQVLAAAAISIFVISSSALVPQVRTAISQRIDSIGNLRGDESGQSRMHQYDEFLSDDSGTMLTGAGLAIDGASRRLDGKTTAVIDSGIIEIFTALGIGIGTLLIVGLVGAIAISFSRFAETTPESILYRAIALSLFCQLPFGNVAVGEAGFCGWLFLGLAAARVERQRGAAVARPPASNGRVPASPLAAPLLLRRLG